MTLTIILESACLFFAPFSNMFGGFLKTQRSAKVVTTTKVKSRTWSFWTGGSAIFRPSRRHGVCASLTHSALADDEDDEGDEGVVNWSEGLALHFCLHRRRHLNLRRCLAMYYCMPAKYSCLPAWQNFPHKTFLCLLDQLHPLGLTSGAFLQLEFNVVPYKTGQSFSWKWQKIWH